MNFFSNILPFHLRFSGQSFENVGLLLLLNPTSIRHLHHSSTVQDQYKTTLQMSKTTFLVPPTAAAVPTKGPNHDVKRISSESVRKICSDDPGRS